METQFDLSERTVILAVPTIDNKIHITAAGAIMEAATILSAHGCRFGMIHQGHCSIIAKARNNLVSAFMGLEGTTDLIFLDADTSFKPDDLVKLVCWGSKYDIVAGLSPLKQDPKVYRSTPYNDENGKQIFTEEGLMEMERVGTAFLLIRRHVLSRLLIAHRDKVYTDKVSGEQHCALFDTQLKDGSYMGEDYTFCERARAIGYKIYVDPSATLSHYGEKEYKGCFGEDVIAPAIAARDAA